MSFFIGFGVQVSVVYIALVVEFAFAGTESINCFNQAMYHLYNGWGLGMLRIEEEERPFTERGLRAEAVESC